MCVFFLVYYAFIGTRTKFEVENLYDRDKRGVYLIWNLMDMVRLKKHLTEFKDFPQENNPYNLQKLDVPEIFLLHTLTFIFSKNKYLKYLKSIFVQSYFFTFYLYTKFFFMNFSNLKKDK